MKSDVYFFSFLLLSATGILLAWQVSKTRTAKNKTEAALAAAADGELRFHSFMNNSPLVGFIKDEAGHMVYINRRYTEVFQRSESEVLGIDDFGLWPDDVANQIRSNDCRILSGDESAELVESIPGADGVMTKWLSVKFPFSMAGKKFLGGVALDITDRERSEEALRDSEERFRSAFANAAIGMALTNTEGRLLQVNPAFCEITGFSQEELLATDSVSITHPDDRQATLDWQAEAIASGNSRMQAEKRYLRKSGAAVWVRDSIGVVRNGRNEPTHFIELIEDITREKEAEEQARVSEERWHLAVEGTNDGMWDWDARTNTVYYSARWKEMLGYKPWELADRPDVWEHLVHPEDLEFAKGAVERHLNKQSPCYSAEYRIRHKSIGYIWVLGRGKAIWDDAGRPVRMIGSHADITERKRAEEQLSYQARHDSLTGLANRRHFLSRLRETVERDHDEANPVCLCVCDIDHFKRVNDSYGHQCGDEVLATLARILREGIRGTDLAARMGGDEFYLLFAGATVPQVMEVVERIRCCFEAIGFGTTGGTVFSATASFGVGQLCAGMDSSDLIGAADRALYTAKKLGRNSVSGINQDLARLRGGVSELTGAGVIESDSVF